MTREELIKELENVKEKHKNDKHFTGELNISDMCTDVLDALSRCEERKQGEWITNDIDGVCICPFCKHEIIGIEEDLNFCCKCGEKLSFPKKKRRQNEVN